MAQWIKHEMDEEDMNKKIRQMQEQFGDWMDNFEVGLGLGLGLGLGIRWNWRLETNPKT